jgi:hypothetical protein
MVFRRSNAKSRKDAAGTAPTPGPYQEGRVDSVHEQPAGHDAGDRTAEGDRPGLGRSEDGRSPDAFITSEVDAKTSRPGRPDKTRS